MGFPAFSSLQALAFEGRVLTSSLRRSLLTGLRPLRSLFVEAKAMIAWDRMFYLWIDIWTSLACEASYGGVFKTLDSYPMEPIGLNGKNHESKNPRSASDHTSRCSIASTNSTSVRRKP